jgi:hypothetical protein
MSNSRTQSYFQHRLRVTPIASSADFLGQSFNLEAVKAELDRKIAAQGRKRMAASVTGPHAASSISFVRGQWISPNFRFA